MTVLSIENLVREYETGEFKLGPISFHIDAGETIALVGQNGAGKTTMFQLITGNDDADEGKILLCGDTMSPDRPDLKRKIGYLPQHHLLPAWVTGGELVAYAAQLHNLESPREKAAHAIKRWGADSYAHKPIAACSHGMQKRIGLALATIHEPELLILDEPFSGLDLTHIRSLENLIKERGHSGKATILASHITPYCARLASRVIMIAAGAIRPLEGWLDLDELKRAQTIETSFFEDSTEC